MSEFALKTTLPPYLREWQETIEKTAREVGLDFFPTVFEMLSYDQMNEIAAYLGFPNRYPHWRFGMEYEQLSKSYEYGLSKIYEMVINNTPSYAYLLEGNSLIEQKLVIAHVLGHVDFFKNNFAFRATDLDMAGRLVDPMKRPNPFEPNRRWIDKMADNGGRVRRHMERLGVSRVEELIDHVLSLENLIDPWRPFSPPPAEPSSEDNETAEREIPRLKAKSYMESFVNPAEYLEEQRKKLASQAEQQRRFPSRPERDVLLFLIQNAPLERWERDVLEVIRDEAYYFVPQMQTKIMNEGWACLTGESLVSTEAGLVPIEEVYRGAVTSVSDGDGLRRVYDRNSFSSHSTIRLRTRRGFTLHGSVSHRVLLSDGVTWRRLDELTQGDRLLLSVGTGAAPTQEQPLAWLHHSRKAIFPLEDAPPESLHIPRTLNSKMAWLLGALIASGRFDAASGLIRINALSEKQSGAWVDLLKRLSYSTVACSHAGERWTLRLRSTDAIASLQEALELAVDEQGHLSAVPSTILRSPRKVVSAFLQGVFDAIGMLSDSLLYVEVPSEQLGGTLQLLVLSLGVLCSLSREGQKWHLTVDPNGLPAFQEHIGTTHQPLHDAIQQLLAHRNSEGGQDWSDEVVELTPGQADVFDLSVEDTHRYVAQGFVNHNSYWHSRIMTERIADASEIIDYAERNASVMGSSKGQLNPYKLGVELFRDIASRWDKGQFGHEWEECDNSQERLHWDRRLGLGQSKIFEVRRLYTDVTFIDEFLTPELAMRLNMFSFNYSSRNERFEIESREFQKVKDRLLAQLTNSGNPLIFVYDANFENRGELLLSHEHLGVDLQVDYARDTLKALVRVWKRPVAIATIVEGKNVLLRYDGADHTSRAFKL